MCGSNKAIELQSYHFLESIQKSPVYTIVRVDFTGGTFLDYNQGISSRDQLQDISSLPLIKNLILQTEEGNQFIVEPDELGLRFAEGALDYRQYLSARKKRTLNMLCYTSGFTIILTTMGWTFINYFL
ncbi:hypothetical protein [Mesobacillus jeotgali]|jgi:hypothetical protein|uniref:Uncharacterized protein n=1 Tax=Mesobacillus jeotgali TaxID=129985 RepID=A0ABY9VLJ0_9BACI|nr:hypothetical protein [Mesobacillus jeotgali]WNF22562.1 hypothetical protein RH061_20780 [Mesobacillus jeotgali]